jgi:hypothetical protein
VAVHFLADGGESVFDIYEATLDWDGEARRIPVDEAETVPLVDMSLLEGYELTVQVQPKRHGNKITVSKKMANPWVETDAADRASHPKR